LTVTGPASPTTFSYSFVKTNTLSGATPTPLEYDGTGTSYPTAIAETAVGTAATDMKFAFDAVINNGANAGNVVIEGLTVSTDTLTVEAGSQCTWQSQ
jgi:hypothetical protein